MKAFNHISAGIDQIFKVSSMSSVCAMGLLLSVQYVFDPPRAALLVVHVLATILDTCTCTMVGSEMQLAQGWCVCTHNQGSF